MPPSGLSAPVYDRCRNRPGLPDTSHIVQSATNALDEVRREICYQAPCADQRGPAQIIKGSRYALSRNLRACGKPASVNSIRQPRKVLVQQTSPIVRTIRSLA